LLGSVPGHATTPPLPSMSGKRTIVAGGTLATDYGVFAADVVIEDGRARVFVDGDAAQELAHAVLDANVDKLTLEPRFIVRTGNAG